jgi:hypothetical protein
MSFAYLKSVNHLKGEHMKKISIVSLALILIFAAKITFAVPGRGPGDRAPRGFLVNQLTPYLCLDVAGAPGVSYGDKIQLAKCERSGRNNFNGSPTDQRWSFRNGFIVNRLSNLCVDVAGAPGVDNGNKIQLAPCEFDGYSENGQPTDQRWEVTREGFIVNSVSGKCLDISGAPARNSGDAAILYDCEFYEFDRGMPTDQRWYFQ